ncbi:MULTISPECIES: Sjogren's syndrome/scleroderma autoantigen 1 family protein [Halomicrobium]|uniref:Sjogrens syndrome scleroderma autoantigen 1 n=2 Tax=Halomicrobium mukohataei TaxID=57705 RepID=C7P025_HALMD|nr:MULTISPECIES: Sjogren's syndrome/scleroderma autoantigen 1 family protein [Halomicrobium]ACV46933.1 Sjogrens syndrome scleroderma autoantigen 1 [Halomicrobium mukohataei DSM 12286]QCD65429.1 hypothetical protein E5139_07180 [Halomicrobium mukohataei]QFR20235.1 hypothetical protein GBQ70_07175 [Halomicrobium sp. ZPS1]
MSDFDKETEREKLREKYGDAESDREATEQMSDLLLKGATMTNAHCNNCGDPIFRYDGQEFCPTCQQPVDRGDDAGDDTGDNIEVTTPSDDATVQFGDADDQQPASEAGSQQPPRASEADSRQPTGGRPSSAGAGQNQRDTATVDGRHDATGPAPEESADPRSAPSVDPAATSTQPAGRSGGAADDPRSGAPDSVDEQLQNARGLLVQTVEQYARRARDADSPRQAREYLEAAREAAETLDATRY